MQAQLTGAGAQRPLLPGSMPDLLSKPFLSCKLCSVPALLLVRITGYSPISTFQPSPHQLVTPQPCVCLSFLICNMRTLTSTLKGCWVGDGDNDFSEICSRWLVEFISGRAC